MNLNLLLKEGRFSKLVLIIGRNQITDGRGLTGTESRNASDFI